MRAAILSATILLGNWGCVVEKDGAAKLTVPTVSSFEAVGSYFVGAEVSALSRKSGLLSGNFKYEKIEGSELEIYVRLDFISGKPIVNIKNSGNINECDQSQPLKKTHDTGSFVGDAKDARAGWRGKWKNEKDQNFHVTVNYYGDGNLYINLTVGLNITTLEGKRYIVYKLSNAILSQEKSLQDTAPQLEDSDVAGLNYRYVAGKFGSGDTCAVTENGTEAG